MNELKKFNRNYLHTPNRGKLSTDLSCFLKWTPQQFADNVDVLTFFRNLNEQLLLSDSNDDLHWNVFQIIEIAIKNTSIRQLLIDSVRIITGISNLAIKLSPNVPEEKQIQLWMLLENITIGNNIKSEEPFLTALIEHLVDSIKGSKVSKDIKLIQTSILTNLCFKNEMAVACLLRFTKSKDLLETIHDMIILWCKIAVAIARFDHEMLEFELISIFKLVFQFDYFAGLMRSKDKRHLRHILELLEEGQRQDEYSINILQQFDFKETIDGMLMFFDSKMDMEEENDEDEKENSEDMNLFLGIVNSILSASNTSLQSNLHRLFTLAIDEVGTVNISSTAIKTVRLIITNFVGIESQDLIKLITRLLENMDRYNFLVASEVYQLLSTVHTKCPDVINQLPEKLINESIDVGKWRLKLRDDNIDNLSMQIYRMQWLFIYANQNLNLLPELDKLMQNKNVHHILANGLRKSTEDICAVTMTLVRSDHFPLKAVSKILTTLSKPQSNDSCESTTRPCFSEPLEKRVNAAVDQLMAKVQDDSPVGNIEHIQILQYQNIFANSKEKLLQSQLKASSDMITLQTSEIGVLKRNLRYYQNKAIELELKEENYKTTYEKACIGYNSIKAKYDKIATEAKELKNEYANLKQERVELETTLKKQEKEIDDLQTQLKNDRETYSADVAKQKRDLVKQHKLEIERLSMELNKQFEQQKKELESQFTKDLENYSFKRTQLKNEHEEEKKDIMTRHAKELKDYSRKNHQLGKELADYVTKNDAYKKKIDENVISLAESEKARLGAEERLAQIMSVLAQIQNR